MTNFSSQSMVIQKHPSELIGIVSGEASGDTLGACLIKALKMRYPSCHFVGVGGEKMIAEGFESLFSQDRLAVMGLVEPLKRLPELLRIRKELRRYFTLNRPKVFIGIDSPDFNLNLELTLREKGIKTVHYVSPSVWAWRQGRIRKIKRAIDLMLCLFPFELAIYKKNEVPVECVGHTLADRIDLIPDVEKARKKLSLAAQHQSKTLVALLPGSRAGEVSRLASVFFEAARICLAQDDNILFLVPAVNSQRKEQLLIIKQQFPDLPIEIFNGRSLDVMQASELVIMASGTTALEAMLLKKPMVIVYKLAGFSYWLLSKLVKVKDVGLPNLLAGKRIVPELIQHDATAQAIAREALFFLKNADKQIELKTVFLALHKELKLNASERAAMAITQLIEKGS